MVQSPCFEDGEFNLPGLKVRDQGPITASPLAPSSSTRSIEPQGYSFGPLFEFVAPVEPSLHHSQIELAFDPSLPGQQRHVFGFALTGLPTDAHFSISVFDDDGLMLGELAQSIEALESSRFFSLESSAPIGAIKIRSGTSGKPSFFQIDHVVYAVPEIATFWMITCAFAHVVVVRCVRVRLNRRPNS